MLARGAACLAQPMMGAGGVGGQNSGGDGGRLAEKTGPAPAESQSSSWKFLQLLTISHLVLESFFWVGALVSGLFYAEEHIKQQKQVPKGEL